jgi:ferric-dicitrate binding protein FerR (iron transport regulator)
MPERDELFVRWELGQTDAADEAALAEALRDPAARRAFARNARVAAALGAPAAAASGPRTAIRKRSARLRRARPAASTWAMAAGVLLVVGLVGVLLFAAPRAGRDGGRLATATPAHPVAHLVVANGARIRMADERTRAAHDGEIVAAGETVEADGATDLVVGRDGAPAARLALAPGTRLAMPTPPGDPAAATTRLRLLAGSVDATVAPRPPGAPFAIASSNASAEVVGTRFTFGLEADGARLAVASGAVRLATPSDAGVLVGAGQTGLAGEGLASLAPPAADADAPLPAGARVLWRATPGAEPGWRGARDGDAWRSLPVPADDPWSNAELRTPLARAGWTVATGTWLRFRYHVERFAPGVRLAVHLKPEDESNYAQDVMPDAGPGWHQALLRVDGAFHHLVGVHQPLAVGTAIHGAVWGALREEGTPATPARFWIRDVVVFAAP